MPTYLQNPFNGEVGINFDAIITCSSKLGLCVFRSDIVNWNVFDLLCVFGFAARRWVSASTYCVTSRAGWTKARRSKWCTQPSTTLRSSALWPTAFVSCPPSRYAFTIHRIAKPKTNLINRIIDVFFWKNGSDGKKGGVYYAVRFWNYLILDSNSSYLK